MSVIWFIHNLLPLWIWIIIGLWVYCNIGFRFAEHKIYIANNPDAHPYYYFLYWPTYGTLYLYWKQLPVMIKDGEISYKFWVTFIWPVTLFWNALFILTLGMMLATEFLLDKFVRILTWGRIKPLSNCK